MPSITEIKLGVTNIYLLKTTNGYVMVDTGYDKYYNRFLTALKKKNIELTDIKYLILTHHHDDHAGFADRIMKDTDLTLILHKKAAEELKNGRSAEEGLKPVTRRVKLLMSLYTLFHRNFDFPPVTVREKDIIIESEVTDLMSLTGIEGKIICTPGHTPDSISVILDNGSAIVGDAVMNFLHISGIHYRPIFCTDINEVYKSWNKILKEGISKILPSHGKPLTPAQLLKKHRETLGS